MHGHIFKLIGLTNDNPRTEEEKELSDITFERFRGVNVLENCRAVVVTTRTGGGNRLDYKENIGDIRDHSLYIGDMDAPRDETYAGWYFRVPENKCTQLRQMCRENKINVRPLCREYEKKILMKLNNPLYDDSEDSTDYSDKEDFVARYGYWHSDTGESETDDNASEDDIMQIDSMTDIKEEIYSMEI